VPRPVSIVDSLGKEKLLRPIRENESKLLCCPCVYPALQEAEFFEERNIPLLTFGGGTGAAGIVEPFVPGLRE
jgi:hypothetical protein